MNHLILRQYLLWLMKESAAKRKSFEFAVRVVNLYKSLCSEREEFVMNKFVMSKQLLRAGTSIGANIREAMSAQSAADFVHKLSIAQKECDESLYWIGLLKETDFLEEEEYISIVSDAEELLKIIRNIIHGFRAEQCSQERSV